MGIFHVEIEVEAADAETTERHAVLVDTGAAYLSLPRTVLARLVGAQTLESFGLGIDPLARRLVPVDASLASGAGLLTA